MPTSAHEQISLIMEIITRLRPRSVLEIGVGWGKYGVLCREYLGKEARIDAIEGFEEYVGPLHRAVYDDVLVGDAREVLPQLGGPYDLVLLIDVFEHFTREDGAAVLAECARLSPRTLISVPATWDPQDGGEHNPLETHRAQYEVRDFVGMSVWRMADHLIALRAPEQLDLRPMFAKWAAATLAPRLTAAAVKVRDILRR